MTRVNFLSQYGDAVQFFNAKPEQAAEWCADSDGVMPEAAAAFARDLDALIAAETAKAREEQREACAKKAEEYDGDVRYHGGPPSWVPSVSVRAAPLTTTPLADEIAKLKKELTHFKECTSEWFSRWEQLLPFRTLAEAKHDALCAAEDQVAKLKIERDELNRKLASDVGAIVGFVLGDDLRSTVNCGRSEEATACGECNACLRVALHGRRLAQLRRPLAPRRALADEAPPPLVEEAQQGAPVTRDATKAQSAPVRTSESKDVLAALEADFGHDPASADVMAALRERAKLGLQKYGTPLHTHNGRDARVDALQEALDGIMYAAQGAREDRPGEWRMVVHHFVAAARLLLKDGGAP